MSLGEWYTLPAGYTSRYEPCYGGIYWHLYHSGERVNGGVSDDMKDAQISVLRYSWQFAAGITCMQPDSEDHDLFMSLLTRKEIRR